MVWTAMDKTGNRMGLGGACEPQPCMRDILWLFGPTTGDARATDVTAGA
jgi:hypothetical protein